MRTISKERLSTLAKSRWRYERFVPRDSLHWKESSGCIRAVPIERRPDGVKGDVLPQGWDHEHCLICMAKLSPLNGFQHRGFTDGNRWLCRRCFDFYLGRIRVHPWPSVFKLLKPIQDTTTGRHDAQPAGHNTGYCFAKPADSPGYRWSQSPRFPGRLPAFFSRWR